MTKVQTKLEIKIFGPLVNDTHIIRILMSISCPANPPHEISENVNDVYLILLLYSYSLLSRRNTLFYTQTEDFVRGFLRYTVLFTSFSTS